MNNSIRRLFFLALMLAALAGIISSTDPDAFQKALKLLRVERTDGQLTFPLVNYILSAVLHPTFSAVVAGIFGVLLIMFVFHSIIHLKHVVKLILKLMKEENKDNDVT